MYICMWICCKRSLIYLKLWFDVVLSLFVPLLKHQYTFCTWWWKQYFTSIYLCLLIYLLSNYFITVILLASVWKFNLFNLSCVMKFFSNYLLFSLSQCSYLIILLLFFSHDHPFFFFFTEPAILYTKVKTPPLLLQNSQGRRVLPAISPLAKMQVKAHAFIQKIKKLLELEKRPEVKQ